MGGNRVRRSRWWGLALVAMFIAAIGAAGALLAGPAPPLAQHSGEVNFSLTGAQWGVLALMPIAVGFLAYALRWILEAPMSLPARLTISAVIVAVVLLALSGVALKASEGRSGSLTIGAQGASASGGASSANGGVGSGGNSSTSGGGTVVGHNNTTGNSSGLGGPNGTSTGHGGKGHGGTNGSAGGSNGTGNNTTGSSPSGGPGAGGSSSVPAARTPGGVSVTFPTWVVLAVAGVLSTFVALLAVPGVLNRLLDRPRHSGGAAGGSVGLAPARLRTELLSASAAIEAGEDPRTTIVRLYGRFLDIVASGVHEVASSTPAEIRRSLLSRFRVSEERTELLTQMFEEARYSSHPILAPAAEQYVQTMRAVERDLFLGAAAP
jgi:hypothetical protein